MNEEELREGELAIEGFLPGASNGTLLARIGDVPVVYKPTAGEAPLWDFPEGTLARREVAAYRLARALGWPNVPATVLRDGPWGPGAVQRFVEAEPGHHFFTLRAGHADRFRAVAAFDAIANNADRKGGHCLLGRDGTIWSIDHGLCFHEVPKLRTVIWDFAEDPLPASLVRDIERVAVSLRDGDLSRDLGALLAREEIDAAGRRAEDLLRSRRFPVPGAERAVPWPLV